MYLVEPPTPPHPSCRHIPCTPGYLITQPTISCVTERAADDAAAVYTARLLRSEVLPAYYPPNIYSIAEGIDQCPLTWQATSKHSCLRSKVTNNCASEARARTERTDDGRTRQSSMRHLMVPMTRSVSLLALLHFCSVDLEVLTPLVAVDKSDLRL